MGLGLGLGLGSGLGLELKYCGLPLISSSPLEARSCRLSE